MFTLQAPFHPSGDQPQAIAALIQIINAGQKMQGLKGVTGSGKTFTMANVIAPPIGNIVIDRHSWCRPIKRYIKPSPPNCTAPYCHGRAKPSFPITPSPISFPITIAISPKRTFRSETSSTQPHLKLWMKQKPEWSAAQ